MPDWLTSEQRHRNMVAIRSTGTRPEATLRAVLVNAFPHRRVTHGQSLPGRPDFVLPALRLAVFADGCFWHGCPTHGRRPDDNAAYWAPKLTRNKRRDRHVSHTLRASGFTVVRVWEHDLQRPQSALQTRLKRAGARSLARRSMTESGGQRDRPRRGATRHER